MTRARIPEPRTACPSGRPGSGRLAWSRQPGRAARAARSPLLGTSTLIPSLPALTPFALTPRPHW